MFLIGITIPKKYMISTMVNQNTSKVKVGNNNNKRNNHSDCSLFFICFILISLKKNGYFFPEKILAIIYFLTPNRKMDESERFAHMFESSIGLVKPHREFVLYYAA